MYKKGDIIVCTMKCNIGVVRRILQSMNDGTYLWEYPDLPEGDDNVFWSGNSSDPKLEYGWSLIKNNQCQKKT